MKHDIEQVRQLLRGDKPDIVEQMSDLIDNAKSTGKTQRQLIGNFMMVSSPFIKLRVSQIESVCESNPSHPKAVTLSQAIAGMKPRNVVSVIRGDVEDILGPDKPVPFAPLMRKPKEEKKPANE
jgi:hypothetical protein